jgi:hypothetical protein
VEANTVRKIAEELFDMLRKDAEKSGLVVDWIEAS